jgi:hypothetical protein
MRAGTRQARERRQVGVVVVRVRDHDEVDRRQRLEREPRWNVTLGTREI